jgi:hypothetical protein
LFINGYKIKILKKKSIPEGERDETENRDEENEHVSVVEEIPGSP